MKFQYLGDSKDSFKWDYHDFLMTEIGHSIFNIALMMTPNDCGNDGKTKLEEFPARKRVIEFCVNLRKNKKIDYIQELPKQYNIF